MIKRNDYVREESETGTGVQQKLMNREENDCAGANSETGLGALPYAV